MGFLDRIFGTSRRDDDLPRETGGREPSLPQPRSSGMPTVDQAVAAEDDRAVERYRYLLRTAPPEQIERAHEEAFARLSEQQRQKVLAQLSADQPPGEAPHSAEPRDLARAATRAEMRRPGYLTGPAFAGAGTAMAGSLLGTIAGVVVGSAVADAFFADDLGSETADGQASDEGAPGGDEGALDQGAADHGDGGGFDVGDGGGFDFGGGGGFDVGGGDF